MFDTRGNQNRTRLATLETDTTGKSDLLAVNLCLLKCITRTHMTMDTNSAVALLKAAGDDIDALSEAIIKTSFLDSIPGEDRQRLRGAL